MRANKPHLSRDALARFCRQHRVRRLSLFGSVLRPDFSADSDVDVLVEFEEDASPGFIGLAAMEREFEGLLGGRNADFRTPDELSRYFREDVLAHAEVQYESS